MSAVNKQRGKYKMKVFEDFGLSHTLMTAIRGLGFDEPTQIQELSIPHIMKGNDVIGESATGSGKTLAFGSGIIQNCAKGKGIQALVLTPTRELAEQIKKALRKFSKYNPLEITEVYGGVSINLQIKKLRTADVVVGTPGRMLDHIGRRTIDLSNVKILVIDEADRMFDMGFIDDVKEIIRNCPINRQTLLFSATISTEITNLAQRYMRKPVKVSAEPLVDPRKLRQVYYDIPDNLKFSLLVHLLKNEKAGLVMVFCNSRRTTDFVAKNLTFNGVDATAIHGGLTQARRNKIMEQFHSKRVYVLVCTDVASRGLDIKGISHVYNYDIPKESKQYIHRIGRTARAGKEGKAINILSSKDYDNFDRVLRDHDVNIVKEKSPRIERVQIKRSEFRRPRKRFKRWQ